MDIPIELCTSAKAYKKAPEKRVLLTALIIVLYAVALPYCYLTAGEPRQTAMVHAQKLADERWAQESSSWSYNDTSSNNTDSLIPGKKIS